MTSLCNLGKIQQCFTVLQKISAQIFLFTGGHFVGSSTIIVSLGMDPDTLDVLLIALNLCGKCGVVLCFCIIFIWSAEIYPTSLRTSLMGVSSVVGRIGQILSPFIADIVRDSIQLNLYSHAAEFSPKRKAPHNISASFRHNYCIIRDCSHTPNKHRSCPAVFPED